MASDDNKKESADDVVSRIFVISMIGAALFTSVVFVYVL